ncbi:MAG: heavy metal-associated domain-containing protein [Thermodesulfobacteriota bacterium]
MNNWKRLAIALTGLLMAALLLSGAQAAGVQRTSYIVNNLSCSSCLATIEAELKGLPGTIGMDANLQQSRVIVDHQPELDYEKIASAITNVGYPAKVDWTATVPDQNVTRYQQRSKYSSGCSSGGCGSSGGAGAGPTAWKATPATGTISRTTLQVSNLSCTSCLNNIAAELSKLSDTYGMNGYLSRGIVIVDHTSALENSRIAAIISGLGYPARAVSTNEVPAQKAFSKTPRNRSPNQGVRSGSGCNSRRGPCNATSASWKTLYKRYVEKPNVQ